MSAPRDPRLPPPPWSRGRVGLLALVAFVVMICAPLVTGVLPLPRRVDRPMVQRVVSLVALGVALPGLLTLLWVDSRRRKRFVGFAFEMAGLQTESYMMRGVQGRGPVGDRAARAFWLPPQRYAPSSFEVHVDSRVAARMVVGTAPGGGWLGMPAVPHAEPDLAHLSVTAEDAAWARGVLADPLARQALVALAVPVASESRWTCIQPGAVLLRTAGIDAKDITPQAVAPPLAALSALAGAAERAPWPRVPAEASAVEKILQRRQTPVLLVVLITLGLLLVLGGAAGVAAYVLDGGGR